MRLRATHSVLPLYALATVVFTWPVALAFTHAIPSSRVYFDARAQAFLLGWDWHALRTHPFGIFSPPIFHPEPNTLTYMDHLLGETAVSAPFLALFRSVAPAYDFVFLLSFVASAWGVYRLTRELGASRAGAFLAGFLYAFSPYRFGNLDQLNQLQTQFFPLALWFAVRSRRRGRTRDLVGLAAVFLLQVYFGWYYTFYLAIALLLFLGWTLAEGGGAKLATRPRTALALLAGVIVLVLPVLLPYLAQQRAMPEFRRTPHDVELASASGLDYLRVNRDALLARWARFAVGGQSYWPGLVTVILAAWGVGRVVRRTRAARVSESAPRVPDARGLRGALVRGGVEGYFLLLAATAYVLSLGPHLHVFGRRAAPLPYALLYRFVPGFQSMRAPGRLASLVLLGLVVLAAAGYEALARRGLAARPVARRAVVAGLFVVAIACAAQRPTTLVELPTAADLPPVYAWLARQPDAPPVLELPVSPSDVNEREVDVLRQYYALYHGKPRLDGASGFVSPRYRRFREAMRAFPGEAALDSAAAMGARLVIVHLSDYDPGARAAMRARLAGQPRLAPMAAFGDDVVFGLARGAPAGSP